MKKSSIELRLYRRATQQLESFCLTSQTLYVGDTNYVCIPLLPSTLCSYRDSVLTFSSGTASEKFDVEDKELAGQILAHTQQCQDASKKVCDRSAKQLEQGLHFVSCIFVDAWNTSRSKRTSLGAWSTLNGKERRMLWTDPTHENVYIGNNKANAKRARKVPVREIRRVVLEPGIDAGSYRMAILTQNCEERCISLYSSDFFKVRIAVMTYRG